MSEGPDIARLASLLADPARANILRALMAGHALTATECAREAGVSAPTATGHLARLCEAGLLSVTAQGRHRYYRIPNAEVALAIEAMMGLAAALGPQRTRPGPRDQALREARRCYDHLAGALATRLFAGMIRNGLIEASGEGVALSPRGRRHFAAVGVDLEVIEAGSRPLCRACLDWSERRPHLAGALGGALLDQAMSRGWLRRLSDSRAVQILPGGRHALLAFCGAEAPGTDDPARDVLSGAGHHRVDRT